MILSMVIGTIIVTTFMYIKSKRNDIAPLYFLLVVVAITLARIVYILEKAVQ